MCAVSLATSRLFTGVPAWCVEFCVWCPWPIGSCSLVCTPGVLCVRCPWPLRSSSVAFLLGVLC